VSPLGFFIILTDLETRLKNSMTGRIFITTEKLNNKGFFKNFQARILNSIHLQERWEAMDGHWDTQEIMQSSLPKYWVLSGCCLWMMT